MELTDAEIETLAYTLLGEARGEGLAGMYAVANVIQNRANSPAYPDHPVDVALQPWQFSTNNGPNMGGGNQTQTRRDAPVGSAIYRQAEEIARAVFENDDPVDITGGSLMYHARGITPYWASSVTTELGTRRIGNHVYYPRTPMPADPIAEAYVAVNGVRVARFRAPTPAEQFGARATTYTPSLEEIESWQDGGFNTPLQRYQFDRIAARDFYGINARGRGAVVESDGRQTPRQRIDEARAEQRRNSAQAMARQGALERTYAPAPVERVSSGSLSLPTESQIIVRELAPNYPTPLDRRGSPWTNFETPLTRSEEKAFQAWKAINAPDDSGYDYDLRGAFKAGLERGADGHMLDTFKKPNHPTFSVESQYAPFAPALAGHWDKKGNFVYPAEAVDIWDTIAPGDPVPRETVPLRSRPLTAKERYAIADAFGLDGDVLRITPEGLAVRKVNLLTVGPDGTPVITPTPRPIKEALPLPAKPSGGPTSSRGASVAAARRLAAAKAEAAAASRIIPIPDPMRVYPPEAAKAPAAPAKLPGPVNSRGAAGAAARSLAAQKANRLPTGDPGMPAPTGVDADRFKYVRDEGPLAVGARIPAVVTKLKVPEIKPPSVSPGITSPVVPARRPTTVTMPPVPTVPKEFLEQIERLDGMPGPKPGAPMGDPINPKKLLDGVEAETRRLAGMPPKEPPMPRPDPRRASTLKSPAPLPAPAPLTFPQQPVKTATVSPVVPPRRPDSPTAPTVPARRPDTKRSTPTVQLELEPAVPNKSALAIAAGVIPFGGIMSNAQKLALAPKPGKVSLSTVKPPSTKPTVEAPKVPGQQGSSATGNAAAETGRRPTVQNNLDGGRGGSSGSTSSPSYVGERFNHQTGSYESYYGQPVSTSSSGTKTFQGSSTGTTYTVGQTYSNGNGSFVANSNGTFTKVK